MVNRFLFAYCPEKRVYMENKYTLAFIVLIHFVMYAVISFAFAYNSTDTETTRLIAFNETGTSLIKYFNEPSFYYNGDNGGKTRLFAKIAFFMIVGAFIPFIAVIIVFVVHVRKYTKLHSRHATIARSLMIVVTVQAVLCIVMLLFPISVLTATWGWNIEYNFDALNSVVVLLTLHGFFDTSCTLYCVAPYRRFIKSHFKRNKIRITVAFSNFRSK
uniref:7TM_GPCR_Srx domain-containing protein n=1 Tax=Panagrellus redivivus TaxID=6233 RepID=A0A7E4V7X6_PANRE